MSINFVHRNVKMPGALKAYAEQHLAGIEKIAGDIIDAEVIVNEEKLQFKVELSLKTRMNSFHAVGRDKNLKQALRDALNTLRGQAKRSKEKIKESKKRAGAKGISMATVALEAAGGRKRGARRPSAPERQDGVMLSDNYARQPITVDEAVFFLNESGENGYMFLNAETNRLAAVFRNAQGGVSLIEPNL